MSDLGRLEKLPSVTNIWASEPRDFTQRFLVDDGAYNLLGAAIGYGEDELEVEAVEKAIGSFRADLILRETGPSSDKLVLVENQFGTFNHDHLGKTITYAGGLPSVRTVVWIAESFRQDHLAAIEWLNEISSEGYGFFALEIELWRIGESKPAPRFNVVARPNEWVKSTIKDRIVAERSLTETQKNQLEYWSAFERELAKDPQGLSSIKPGPYSFTQRGIGKSGVSLNGTINTQKSWVRTEIYLAGPRASEFFLQLYEHKSFVEEDLDYELDWQDLDGNDKRICIQLSSTDIADKTDWPRQHKWLAEKHREFFRAFATIVRGLKRNLEL